MPGEETLDLKRVVNAISSANEPEKQAEIMNNALGKLSVRQAADAWLEIASRALDDLGFAKAFLLFLDQPMMNQVMGKKAVGQIEFTLKGADKYKPLYGLFEELARFDAKSVKLVKAKAAMLFQLMYLVRDRTQEEGLPALRSTAAELVKAVLDDPEVSARKIKFDLNAHGKAYWNLLIEQLKEADFQSKDNVVYEMLLNDSLIEQYQTGSILAASGASGAGEARLSDAVMARLGTNIIKRLNLLLRTTQMYQSVDHPSVSAALNNLLSTMENAMQGREGLTLSRLGSDLLIEDIKIKKKEKFIEDFVAALEARNVNSMTIKRGISLDEVRAFLMVFAQNEIQIKKAGGVKKVFETKGVSHVLVDQFRYGIISGDQQEQVETLAADEKMVSSVVFSEILNKLQKGDVESLSAADIGQMIKDMLGGALSRDKASKKSLAQMIMMLDPELAEQAVFSRDGVRDEMSWSSARRMIDQLVEDLGRGGPEDRIRCLDNLERMAEVAVSRNKETSINLSVDKLIERVRSKERDLDVLSRLYDALASISRYLTLNGKYVLALKIVRAVANLANYCENLPADKKDDYTRAIAELSAMMMLAVSNTETLQALIREMEGESATAVDAVMKILETVGTEQTIGELLDAFKNPSRTLRNRAFQVLLSIGEKTLAICTWKLKHLNDPLTFPRRAEGGELTDDAYYIARNCLELTERLGGKHEMELIRQISDDPDPRLRAGTIAALAKLEPNDGLMLARLRLSDSDRTVAEAAINALGQIGGPDVAPALIDLFYAEPGLRLPILAALGRVGGAEAERVLISAAHYRGGGAMGKIFRDDEKLMVAAIKALGAMGGEPSRNALRRFINLNRSVFLSAVYVPWEYRKRRKDLLKISSDALSRIEYRLQGRSLPEGKA